jgi:hypothetical protein
VITVDNTNKIDDEKTEMESVRNSPIDDRLKILANLLIDRILEDKRNGVLSLKK